MVFIKIKDIYYDEEVLINIEQITWIQIKTNMIHFSNGKQIQTNASSMNKLSEVIGFNYSEVEI